VVVDLTWKNTTRRPRSSTRTSKDIRLQTAACGGQIFLPAEKIAKDSFFNAKAVKPGKKQTGEAIFQVPARAAEAIRLRGAHPQLAVWEFSTASKKQSPPAGSSGSGTSSIASAAEQEQEKRKAAPGAKPEAEEKSSARTSGPPQSARSETRPHGPIRSSACVRSVSVARRRSTPRAWRLACSALRAR
jgi:hypothetical protein